MCMCVSIFMCMCMSMSMCTCMCMSMSMCMCMCMSMSMFISMSMCTSMCMSMCMCMSMSMFISMSMCMCMSMSMQGDFPWVYIDSYWLQRLKQCLRTPCPDHCTVNRRISAFRREGGLDWCPCVPQGVGAEAEAVPPKQCPLPLSLQRQPAHPFSPLLAVMLATTDGVAVPHTLLVADVQGSTRLQFAFGANYTLNKHMQIKLNNVMLPNHCEDASYRMDAMYCVLNAWGTRYTPTERPYARIPQQVSHCRFVGRFGPVTPLRIPPSGHR